MGYKCYNCGKKSIYGTSHRHHPGVAGRQHLRRAPRTQKIFRPNLHTAHLLVNGLYRKVKLCSKCRRLLKIQGRIKTWVKPVVSQTVPKAHVVKVAIEKTLVPKAKKETIVKPAKPLQKEKSTPTVSVEDLVGKKE